MKMSMGLDEMEVEMYGKGLVDGWVDRWEWFCVLWMFGG